MSTIYYNTNEIDEYIHTLIILYDNYNINVDTYWLIIEIVLYMHLSFINC